MRTSLRIAIVAAAAALCGLTVPSAAQAASYPTDCTVTTVSTPTKSMTCTARPAGQHWRLLVYCMGWGLQDEAYGPIVTGNGTSTATCPGNLRADFPNFVVVA